MKTLLFIALLSFPVSALAATLEWDRNGESDMASYSVYACFTKDCQPMLASGMHQGITQQTAAGTKPTFVMDLSGKEGAVAVTAKDKSGNESGFSVPLPFDKVAPSTPASLILR